MVFNLDTKASKKITNREAVGLGVGATEINHPSPPIQTFSVSVKEGAVHNGDVMKTYVGPISTPGGGAGTLFHNEDHHGFSTPTGNKIHINGEAGSETIELIHHTGASIVMDSDGSIFIQPTSLKGYGFNSDRGDGVIAAGQRIIIKGNSGITIETDGDLDLNVGGSMHVDVGGDYVLNVDGATTISTDGTTTVESTKDYLESIGGTRRSTVAGDFRQQVVGGTRFDSGKDLEARSDQNVKIYSNDTMELLSHNSTSLEVDTGNLQVLSQGDITVGSVGGGMYLTSSDNISLDAQSTVSSKSNGNFVLSTKGTMYIDATSSVDINGQAVSVSSQSTLNVNASGAIDIRGSTIDLNKGAPSPETLEPSDIRTPPSITSPQKAEYPDAKTIISAMTTEVDAPDFPHNARRMNAEQFSRYENEGGQPNPIAKAAAYPNQGAGSPATMGQSQGSISQPDNYNYDGNNNKANGENNPFPLPSSVNNANDKLSNLVTVGMLPGLMRCGATNNGLQRQEILKNASHLAYNCIDPILRQFGARVRITDHLRLGSGGSRHYSGKAVDIASAAHNFAETAEVAAWARDNVAFDRLFLEANHAGTIHMHIEAAPPGSKGERTVWTCADPHCSSRIDGLQLAFAEQGLKKMGFA